MALTKRAWLLLYSVLLSVALLRAAVSGRLLSYTCIQPEQLATEYDALVFREGPLDNLYLFSLRDRQLEQIASNVSQRSSISPDDQLLAIESGGNIYVVNVDGTGSRQVIDSEGRIDGLSLTWAPDGRLLAYILSAPSSPKYQRLCVVDTDTAHSKCITPDELRVGIWPLWLPDGHRILFRAREWQTGSRDDVTGVSTSSVHYDLYVVDGDGSNLVNLTDGLGNITDVKLSPDGRTALLTSELENQEASKRENDYMYDFRVYLMDLESQEAVEVMSLLLGRQSTPPFAVDYPWSPSSEWVLLPAHWSGDLMAVKPNGTMYHEIIAVSHPVLGGEGISMFTASLSPDGKLIAGGGWLEKGRSESLCVVDVDGQNFRALIPDVYVDHMVWSPDSKSIFFKYTVEQFSEDYRYGIVNADGSSFYEPFANLAEKPVYVDDVHWVRLPPQASAPTVMPSATFAGSPTSTPAPAIAHSPTITPSPTVTPTPTDTPTSAPSPTVISLVSKPILTATATASSANTATPASTQSPGSGVCTVSGAIVLVAVLGWWALRKRG